MLCLSWAGCPSFNTVDVNQREKRHGEKVEWIRQSWPLFMREGYLCEQGERSSLGYEAPDVWCWQETLTFGVKLEFFFLNDWELEYCSIKLCFSLSQCYLLLWWRASLIDDVETGLLHCCNRSNILTWHDLVITSLKKTLNFSYLKSPFLLVPFPHLPLHPCQLPSSSITSGLSPSAQPISLLYPPSNLSTHQFFLSIALLNQRLSSVCSSGARH